MKKIYLLFVFIVFAGMGYGQTTDLIITEYIEGSSNNKALEIYNGTGIDVDLSNYQVWKISNGGSWPENTLDLSGTLSDGDVYVIYNSSSDPAIVAVGDVTWGSATWNGDDAVGIAKDDGTGTFVLIDAVGEDGPDPGSGWDVAGVNNATKNHTLVRKSTICSPNTNWDTSRGTNATDSEWIVYNQDEFSYLGSHTSNCGGTSGPDNPTALLATTQSSSEIDLSWTRNGDLDQVMLVWSPDNSFGTPVDGDSYAVGDTIPGGDSVLYVGVDTTYNHTSLTQGTQYFYKAFSVDGSTAYSSGVTDDATTYKDEPTNHAASFAAGTPGSGSIPLTWSDNDGTVVADSFLIMINTTGTFTPPVDGTPQPDDLDVSDGEGVVNVAHGEEAYTWTGLSQSTHYYFTIYPYTNTGSAVDFKTDGTVPATDATTTGFTTTLPYTQTFDADLGDCQTYSVLGDTKEWLWYSDAARMNGYNSGDLEEDWLFIPGINLDNYSNEAMTFDTKYNYGTDDTDNYLKLMYSTDYPGSGDPSGYTWDTLAFTRPSTNNSWTSSGSVDLSSITGTSVYIAFKYHYSSGNYRRWDVDNISIEEATVLPEPTNYPANFAATTKNAVAITNTWTDATGTQVPDGYLILAKDNTGSFTTPVDGTPVNNDADLSDGNGAMNVPYGDETYEWSGLSFTTTYDFVIYSYTNSGSNIDYKTDGTAPTASATTNAANTDLIISEVADPGDFYQSRFVELYNISSDTIFFEVDDWYLSRQTNGGNWFDIHLSDTVLPGETYTIARKSSDFITAYGFDPDKSNTAISGNGDDGYFLYYGGKHDAGTLVDAYGVIDQDGTGQAWEYEDSKAVRKRSVGSPNATWTASEWVITEADTVNMTPGQHMNYVTWDGSADNDWNTKANWDNEFIPDASMNVAIPAASTPEIGIASYAQCWDLDIDATASLTILSENGGQGALVVWGTPSGNVTTNCFVTTGQWHGISTPVSGQTGNSFYLNGNPDVWAKHYNESDNTYTYISNLSTPLGDMKGWMVWIDTLSGTLSDTILTFEGAIRSGTVSPSESIVRSQSGADYGYNFVGNPFTSAIDWDNTVGWTKTNIDTAIYTYNDGNWATYANGTGTNGGSRYIAMNQGFFVQVADDGSTSGTLTATHDVQLKHTASFMKSNRANDYSLVRLQISAEGLTDETVVKLLEGSTEGFDSRYDAHKLFSFNTNHPQIFSTANDKMSINTLPMETGFVEMDVTGKNGDLMTIAATERENMNEVWLVDNVTGAETDLTTDSYTFTYDNSITDRFTLHFSIVNVPEQNEVSTLFNIYSCENRAYVIIPADMQATIEVYNLLGQKVKQAVNRSGFNQFELDRNQYYIIKVYNNFKAETKKVLIN